MSIFKIPRGIHYYIAKWEKAQGLPVTERGPSKYGWSSVSVYQTCPHLFANKERRKSIPYTGPGADKREVGNLFHWLCELRYMPGSTVQWVDTLPIKDALLMLGAMPSVVEEAFRVFDGYQAHYGAESYIKPLAIEGERLAPTVGMTTRVDLVAEFHGHPTISDGVYFMDHKTTSQMTAEIQKRWSRDGQVLTALHAGIYGVPPVADFRGVIVNIVGKQKVQKFHRAVILPDDKRLQDFQSEMEYWNAQINLSKATGIFRRERASCSGKYGLCDLFEEC
jgi:hypothetical protein